MEADRVRAVELEHADIRFLGDVAGLGLGVQARGEERDQSAIVVAEKPLYEPGAVVLAEGSGIELVGRGVAGHLAEGGIVPVT